MVFVFDSGIQGSCSGSKQDFLLIVSLLAQRWCLKASVARATQETSPLMTSRSQTVAARYYPPSLSHLLSRPLLLHQSSTTAHSRPASVLGKISRVTSLTGLESEVEQHLPILVQLLTIHWAQAEVSHQFCFSSVLRVRI